MACSDLLVDRGPLDFFVPESQSGRRPLSSINAARRNNRKVEIDCYVEQVVEVSCPLILQTPETWDCHDEISSMGYRSFNMIRNGKTAKKTLADPRQQW